MNIVIEWQRNIRVAAVFYSSLSFNETCGRIDLLKDISTIRKSLRVFMPFCSHTFQHLVYSSTVLISVLTATWCHKAGSSIEVRRGEKDFQHPLIKLTTRWGLSAGICSCVLGLNWTRGREFSCSPSLTRTEWHTLQRPLQLMANVTMTEWKMVTTPHSCFSILLSRLNGLICLARPPSGAGAQTRCVLVDRDMPGNSYVHIGVVAFWKSQRRKEIANIQINSFSYTIACRGLSHLPRYASFVHPNPFIILITFSDQSSVGTCHHQTKAGPRWKCMWNSTLLH